MKSKELDQFYTKRLVAKDCYRKIVDFMLDNKIDETKVKETPKIEVEKEVPADDPLENDAQFKNINIEQIKQELDAFGVKYDPKAKKKELYDLMLAQGK